MRKGTASSLIERAQGEPMPNRFAFRQVDQRDLVTFFRDGEVRAKLHEDPQACHQTSHGHIVQRRNSNLVEMPHGGVVNNYVAFYLSPVTAFTYAIHQGSVEVISPSADRLGMSEASQRAFLVASVPTIFRSYPQVCFSNYALNTNVPLPVVIADQNQFETHIKWLHFDDTPRTAEIPEINYEGVCRYFNSSPTPGPRHHRSTERMAELLVKDAVSINDFCAIVLPTQKALIAAQALARENGYQGVIVCRPECFI